MVIAKRYKCNHCNHSFSGLNQRANELLPEHVQALRPFAIYNQTRIDNALVEDLTRDVVSGKSFSDFHKRLVEVRFVPSRLRSCNKSDSFF